MKPNESELETASLLFVLTQIVVTKSQLLLQFRKALKQPLVLDWIQYNFRLQRNFEKLCQTLLQSSLFYVKTNESYFICSVVLEVNESDFLCGAALAGQWKELFCITQLSCCLVLAAFILPIRIYPSHLAQKFILMSFLLHKVTFIHATLAAVFQLQRSKVVTALSAQS